MIDFLIIYIITILVTIGINKYTYLTVLKNIVNSGKFVIKGAFDTAFDKLYGISVLETIIPVWNVIKAINVSFNAINSIDVIYNVLKDTNCLENMDMESIKEFNDEPTLMKTQKIVKKHEKDLMKYSMIIYCDNSVIIFDQEDSSIHKIKRTVGPVSHQEVFDTFERLNHAIELYKASLDVYYKREYNIDLEEDALQEFLKIPYCFDLSLVDDSMSVDEYKKLLNETIDSIQKENDKPLIRKRIKK